MESPEVETRDRQTKGPPFQYSLRTMFIVTTALAVALTGVYAGTPWVSALTGLAVSLLVPIVLTIGMVYGRGYGKTFCIGGLFPAGVIFIAIQPVYMDLICRGIMARGDVRGTGLVYYLTFVCPSPEEIAWRVGFSIFAGAVAIVVSGMVAVGVHWMIEAPQQRQRREALLREQTSEASGLTTATRAES